MRRFLPLAWRDLRSKRPSLGENIDALDGVRGLAVLLVVASHADGLHLAGQGGVGVWLFFCLSAFLLTLPYARDPGRLGDLRGLRHYAARRIARILPLYYLVLTANFLLTEQSFGDYGLHLLLVRADGHFWTIPQEFFFYLCLPFIALLYPFVFRRRLALAIPGLGLLAILGNVFVETSTFSIGVFLTGMVFAYLYASGPVLAFSRKPCVRRALGSLAIAILVVFVVSAPHYQRLYYAGWIAPSVHPLGWVHYGVFALLGSLLIYTAVACPGSLVQRILAWAPLRTVGIVSFGIYLLHPFVLEA